VDLSVGVTNVTSIAGVLSGGLGVQNEKMRIKHTDNIAVRAILLKKTNDIIYHLSLYG
jgi:hypothetical protein